MKDFKLLNLTLSTSHVFNIEIFSFFSFMMKFSKNNSISSFDSELSV